VNVDAVLAATDAFLARSRWSFRQHAIERAADQLRRRMTEQPAHRPVDRDDPPPRIELDDAFADRIEHAPAALQRVHVSPSLAGEDEEDDDEKQRRGER